MCIFLSSKSKFNRYMENRTKNNKESLFEVCANFLYDQSIKSALNNDFSLLNKWREVRNSIVHKDKIITMEKANEIRDIVVIDDENEYLISFFITSKQVKSYLVLTEQYVKNICRGIFYDFDKFH